MERLIENVNKFTMVSLTDLFDGLCFNKDSEEPEEPKEDMEENSELEEPDLDNEETYRENGLDEIEKQFKMIELIESITEEQNERETA